MNFLVDIGGCLELFEAEWTEVPALQGSVLPIMGIRWWRRPGRFLICETKPTSRLLSTKLPSCCVEYFSRTAARG
jgi:hypothetical protein